MFEKPQAPSVLGLTIDGSSIHGTLLTQTNKKLKIEKFFHLKIETVPEEGENVKLLYKGEDEEEFTTSLQKQLIVTAIPITDLLVRSLDLKLTKDKDIDATLAFQMEPLLPYPVENAIIDKILLAKDKEGSKLTVFSLRKDHLTKHLNTWQSFKIEPEVVSAAPQALALFAKKFLTLETPFFVLYLASENSFAIAVDQGKLIAAQALPANLQISNHDTHAEIFNQKFYESSEESSYKHSLDELKMAITRTLYSLNKQLKGKEVNDLLITGPGALIEEFSEKLSNSLNKKLLILNEDPNLGVTSKELLYYALSIGEALSALPGSKEQINFRQQEFSYPEPWKRLKQPILIYFGLCFSLAIALFLFGQAYMSYQEGNLRKNYLNLLNVMNKPYSDFEKQLLSKNSNHDTNSIPTITELNLDEIKKRLDLLEKEIKLAPQIFPLQPNTPVVSDVLAWISSHSNFVNRKQNDSKDLSKSMQIQSFNYSMVKRPEPTKKQEKYQIKIELEFSSPTPKMAREFHDALIAPNDMVDPKGEIKWNSNRDLYRTSFYLKDKTIYSNL